MLETSFPLTSSKILDVARMWLGCGSDVARTWLGCGLDVARVSLGRVSRCGSKSLAEVKGKRFPADRKLAIANLRSKIASDCDCDRLVHSDSALADEASCIADSTQPGSQRAVAMGRLERITALRSRSLNSADLPAI